MAGKAATEIDALIDGQRFGRFNLALLIWSFLATLTDGFELSALGFAVPHLARQWHVSPAAMGPMLSASLAGMFIGAPLLGWIGDRWGRRPAIAIGCVTYGIATLGVLLAGDVAQMTALRFLTGIGMGGVLPNAIALNSEASPRRLRARLVILMFMGVTLGGSVPGLIDAWLVPSFGWHAIFWSGGLGALIVGAAAPFVLAESPKFLARRPERRAELLRTLRRMRPDAVLPADLAGSEAATEGTEAQPGIATLFADGLAPVTLLLWLCFATTLMANFFLNNWLPTLFRQAGVAPQTSALVATMYHLGATAGGVVMSLIMDRLGFVAVAGMLLVAVPATIGIGLPGLSPAGMGLMVAAAGFCVLGGQFGSNAAAGLIYPTAARSRALGLAFGVGRVGSVLGPIMGARLIGLKLPLITMLAAAAVPVLIGAIAALALALIGRRRFGGWRLEEVPPAAIQGE